MTPEQERTHWRLAGQPLMPEYRAFVQAWGEWYDASHGEMQAEYDHLVRLSEAREDAANVFYDAMVAEHGENVNWEWASIARDDLTIYVRQCVDNFEWRTVATYTM